ncbi:response regulator [Paenibacillus sp. SI8]|uniref:response regulator n=1 Tax=unclassified Paenibacillus TaxID=185978 RepID=UPI003465955D
MTSSLRFKLIAILLLVTSISLALVGTANYMLSKNKLIVQMEDQSISSVKNSAQNLHDFLSIRFAQVKLITHLDGMKKRTTISAQLQYLTQALKNGGDQFYTLGVSDLSGHMVFANGNSLEVSDKRQFQEALHGKSFISDPYVDPIYGTYIISLTVPVFNENNEVMSIVDVALDADQTFHQHLHPPSEFNKTMIINNDGLILYHSDPSKILLMNIYTKFPELGPVFDEAKSKENGFIDVTTDGQRVRMFYARIPDMDWFLAYSMPIAAFEAPTSPLLWWTIGLLVLTELVLCMFIYWTIARVVIHPVSRILRVTEAVADGDFYMLPIDIKSKDELGSLAVSVNGMIENLRELFEPFEAFIHDNQYAMIVTDPTLTVTHMNEYAEEMLGYSNTEIAKKATPLLWLDTEQLKSRMAQACIENQEYAPEDFTAKVIKSLQHFKEDTDWTWYHKAGRRIYVKSNISIITHPNGSLKGYVFIARDISDIKESEETKERMLAIVESAHDSILSFDKDGYIFYINQEARRIIGIDNMKFEPTHFSNFVDIPSGTEFDEGLVIAAEQGYWEFEGEITTKNNRQIYTLMTIVPHRSADNDDCYYSVIARDITEEVRAKEGLIRAKQEADEANLAKSIFLARMSHEIRTPLNGIIGLSYLMERTEMSLLQQDYIAKISKSSISLSEIINDILDFSKLEADRVTIEQIAFQLDDTIDHVCETLSVLLGHKPIDFICDISSGLSLGLIGDPLRIYQVLLNLTSNAIKFTEQGTIILQVEIEHAEETEVRLAFTITDTGVGMNEEEIAKLFMPFVQADGSTSRKYGGTGLGLVITKSLVENMGGTIQVWSTPRIGSAFRVSLPFALSSAKMKTHTLLPVRALVVEDHPQLMNALVSTMQRMCEEAVGVNSWKEARSRAEETGKPSLMLLDMEAADMYDEEVLLDMLRLCAANDIRTAVYTTLEGRDELEKLPKDAAPDAVLVKPISRGVLHRTLQELIPLAESTLQAPSQGVAPVIMDVKVHRILLVEDNGINQTVARSLLETRGFLVDVADNGFEALKLIKHESYDVILMDIHMPVLDGIETTKRIRHMSAMPHVPIIAVTADSTLEQRKACLQAGMNDTISKPIMPEQLFEVVDYYVNKEETFIRQALDVEQALVRFGGKSHLYDQMLGKFRVQYQDAAAQLKNYMQMRDFEEAVRFLHTLRGASSNLSANRLFELATDLQDALDEAMDMTPEPDSDTLTNLMKAKLQHLEDALEEVFRIIEKRLID